MTNTVIVNAEALQKVADELGLAASVVQKSIFRAINGVAAKSMTRSRREIVSQVNLTQSYVRERMRLSRASPNRRKAIIAAGMRPTRLATYGAKQRTRGAKGSKGDSLRGIPPGRKQSGISVAVKRGGRRKILRKAFFVPLRAGKLAAANGMGVFIRTGPRRKDIEHLYGPSVDQVFEGVIDYIEDDVILELNEALLRQANYEFERALKK